MEAPIRGRSLPPLPKSCCAATPARFRQETLAARRMLEHVACFNIRPQDLAADKAYGSGEFLAWLLERKPQAHPGALHAYPPAVQSNGPPHDYATCTAGLNRALSFALVCAFSSGLRTGGTW